MTETDVPLDVAVRVAACAVPTAATAAVNAVLVEPPAMVTDAGTLTALLLLERETVTPPEGAAAESETVQPTFADPVTEVVSQEIELSVETSELEDDPLPLPCNLIVAVVLVELCAAEPPVLAAVVEVSPVMVNVPEASVAACGLKCTTRIKVLPALIVTGSVPSPSTEKAELDRAAAVMEMELVPLLVRVALTLED